jgi:hypothetical protein
MISRSLELSIWSGGYLFTVVIEKSKGNSSVVAGACNYGERFIAIEICLYCGC